MHNVVKSTHASLLDYKLENCFPIYYQNQLGLVLPFPYFL